MNRYKDAGVDVEAGYDLVKRIKKDIAATSRPETNRGVLKLVLNMPLLIIFP